MLPLYIIAIARTGEVADTFLLNESITNTSRTMHLNRTAYLLRSQSPPPIMPRQTTTSPTMLRRLPLEATHTTLDHVISTCSGTRHLPRGPTTTANVKRDQTSSRQKESPHRGLPASITRMGPNLEALRMMKYHLRLRAKEFTTLISNRIPRAALRTVPGCH